ncbi:hypothetical protein I546_6456 [Mycobacterium kansasii 732]|nr:hypothetical protein I546_6456 [Mycobacterium kansasii 732]
MGKRVPPGFYNCGRVAETDLSAMSTRAFSALASRSRPRGRPNTAVRARFRPACVV